MTPKIEIGFWMGSNYIKVGDVEIQPPKGEAENWHIEVNKIDELVADGLIAALDELYRDGKIISCD